MKKILFILLILIIYSPSVFASPDGYLIIPKIGLFKSIHLVTDSDPASGTYFYDLSELGYGVGHLENTSWGTTEGGRTVLVGHTPGGFEDIVKLVVGDVIIISMGENYYELTITDKQYVNKEDGSVIYSPPSAYEVVLITCTDNPDTRLIIKAQ